MSKEIVIATNVEARPFMPTAVWQHAVEMYYEDSPDKGTAAWALQDWCGKYTLENWGDVNTIVQSLLLFFLSDGPVGMTCKGWYPRDGWGDHNTQDSKRVDGETLVNADLKGLKR